MVYKNVIRRKLISIAEYIQELEPFLDYSYEQYVANYFIKRTGERLLQLIVENMVDINSIIIAEMNHVPPKDYYSSFEIVGELGIIPPEFAKELAPCTGMRNRLVHEYDKIQDEIVFQSIKPVIKMVNPYMEFIKNM